VIGGGVSERTGREWVPWAAAAVAAALVIPFFGSTPNLWMLMLLVVAAGSCGALWHLLHGRLGGAWGRTRYDLRALKEVDDDAKRDASEPPEVPPDADVVVCLACGTPYAAWMPVCPNCKRMAGH
jgi:hypothetical protein